MREYCCFNCQSMVFEELVSIVIFRIEKFHLVSKGLFLKTLHFLQMTIFFIYGGKKLFYYLLFLLLRIIHHLGFIIFCLAFRRIIDLNKVIVEKANHQKYVTFLFFNYLKPIMPCVEDNFLSECLFRLKKIFIEPYKIDLKQL